MTQARKLRYDEFIMSILPPKIKITIHRGEDGIFWAESPDVPNCYTQGKNIDETIAKMKDAIFTHFEVSARDSDPRRLNTEEELSAELRFAHV